MDNKKNKEKHIFLYLVKKIFRFNAFQRLIKVRSQGRETLS